jgi:hypothetical protein
MTHRQKVQEMGFPVMFVMPLGNGSLLAVCGTKNYADKKKGYAKNKNVNHWPLCASEIKTVSSVLFSFRLLQGRKLSELRRSPSASRIKAKSSFVVVFFFLFDHQHKMKSPLLFALLFALVSCAIAGSFSCQPTINGRTYDLRPLINS